MTPLAADRVPVIVGVGETIDRPREGQAGLEPFALMREALLKAQHDAGAPVLSLIDRLQVVLAVSWWYDDLADTLVKSLRLGCKSFNGPVGGEQPVLMLAGAAQAIAEGRTQGVAVVGAEAMRSRIKNATAGWTPIAKPAFDDADFVSALARSYGLAHPIDVYPLYENALRAARGQSLAEAQAESGRIWSDFSRVAAANPIAWLPTPMDAAVIATASWDNRPIAHPYLKLMVAQPSVNQGAAFIVLSLAAARAAGVPEHNLIYVGSGAGGHEPKEFLARDRYDRSAVMETTLHAALARNGLADADIDQVELYSCFPCVPKMARRALDLRPDLVPSVTGGLTFFGGPGNNYMSHAIAAMVRTLRSGGGRHGLLYGQGEFVTKHHAVVISTIPPTEAPVSEDIQAAAEARFEAIPGLLPDYAGPAIIETYTVISDRHGAPDIGIVVLRTSAGSRVPARVTRDDPAALSFLIDGLREPIGASGEVTRATDGLNRWTRRE